MKSRWSGLQSAVRGLDPGYFGLVMATGIVSRALTLDGAAVLPGILLGVAITAYLLLAAASAWRLARYPREVRSDARDPRRSSGFFTLPAGSGVLAAGLAADGHVTAAAVLLAMAGTSWVLLSYGLPLLLGPRPALTGVNGTWFLWPVGAQSVAVAVTSLAPPLPASLAAALAVGCWAVGVILYLLVAGLVVAVLLAVPVRPAALTPAYWVFMGATAISVLAGAQILRLPPVPLLAAVRPVVAGLSVVLWAFGTWLIPLLLVLGVWRHAVRRVPLAYEPGWWSIAFPVGMYGVACHELGTALRVPWLVTLGRAQAWAALTVWALVFLAMSVALMRARPPEAAG